MCVIRSFHQQLGDDCLKIKTNHCRNETHTSMNTHAGDQGRRVHLSLDLSPFFLFLAAQLYLGSVCIRACVNVSSADDDNTRTVFSSGAHAIYQSTRVSMRVIRQTNHMWAVTTRYSPLHYPFNNNSHRGITSRAMPLQLNARSRNRGSTFVCVSLL